MNAVLICQPVVASTRLIAVPHADHTSASILFDHLGIEQLRQRHPTGLGRWAMGLAPRRLHPLPIVRQQRRAIILEPVVRKRGTQRGASTSTT